MNNESMPALEPDKTATIPKKTQANNFIFLLCPRAH